MTTLLPPTPSPGNQADPAAAGYLHWRLLAYQNGKGAGGAAGSPAGPCRTTHVNTQHILVGQPHDSHNSQGKNAHCTNCTCLQFVTADKFSLEQPLQEAALASLRIDTCYNTWTGWILRKVGAVVAGESGNNVVVAMDGGVCFERHDPGSSAWAC